IGFEFDAHQRVTVAGMTSSPVSADLYVAADGTRSRARRALFPQWPMSGAGVQEIVAMVRCPETIRWAGGAFNKFFAPQGGVAFGVLQVDDQHVVWYVQFDSEVHEAPSSGEEQKRFVESLVGNWTEPIPHLIAATDFSGVHVWRPVDSDLVPSFYRQN